MNETERRIWGIHTQDDSLFLKDNTYAAPASASLISDVYLISTPSNPQWRSSSATPSKAGA